MAAVINLKVSSDFAQASKDLKTFGNISESERKKIEKFTTSFKTERIDAFIDRNNRATAAIKATKGPLEATQKEYSGLQREIQNLIRKGLDPQDDALKPLIKRYDELNKEMAQNTQIAKANEAATKGAANALKALAVAGAGAAIAITKGTFSLAEAGDEYAKTSRRIGITAEALQELEFAADRQGVSGETLTKGLQKLNKNVGDLRAGYGSLNTILKATNPELLKQLKNAENNEEAFNIAVNALDAMENQLEKTSVAQALFGRSGIELLTVTEGGTQSLNALREEARAYGVISNQTAAQSEEFVDAMTNLKAAFNGIKISLLQDLIPGFTNAIIGVTNFIMGADDLSENLEILGLALAGVTSGLVAFLAVTKGGAILSGIITAFKTLNLAIAANPIGAIAVIITTLLVPAIILLIKNWDFVSLKIAESVEILKQQFALFANGIQTGWTVAVNNIKIAFLSLGQIIIDKVLGAVQKFLEFGSKLPFVGEMLGKLADNVENVRLGFEELTTKAKENSQEIIAGALLEREAIKVTTEENIKNIQADFDKREKLLEAQKEANKNANKNAVQNNQDALNAITKNQKNALEVWAEDFKEFWDKQKSNVSQAVNLFKGFANSITTILTNLNNEELNAAREKYNILSEEEEKYQNFLNTKRQEEITEALSNNSDLTESQKEEIKLRIAAEEAAAKRQAELAAEERRINRENAIAQRVAANLGIVANTGQAVMAAVAASPLTLGLPWSALIAAKGIAEGIAVNSQALPSAQTGTGALGIQIPDSGQSSRADTVGVMASPGETVSVTPRGEDPKFNLTTVVEIGRETLFRVINQGIQSGEVRITTNNIQGGAIA